jgi:hypothetical protein
MNLEVVDHINRDELDTKQFESMGLVAQVYHDKEQNSSDGPNRHALVIGDDAIIVESQ